MYFFFFLGTRVGFIVFREKNPFKLIHSKRLPGANSGCYGLRFYFFISLGLFASVLYDLLIHLQNPSRNDLRQIYRWSLLGPMFETCSTA
jgi:hypothetical protein